MSNILYNSMWLSQAHCRLMYRTIILPMDAIMAVSLVDLSMQDCTLDDTVNALHSTFAKYPDYEYLCTAKKLLERLNLSSVWQEEILYYGKLLQVDHKTLESEINKGDSHIFSKYDNVNDDNMPLSATLVTSSYFDANKQKNKEDNASVDGNDKENVENKVVNDRLAATLKKHATLNKDEMKPPVVQKRKSIGMRKRKEVTVETNLIMTKKKPRNSSKTKERDKINYLQKSDDDISSDENDLSVGTKSDNLTELKTNVQSDQKYQSNKNNRSNESININLSSKPVSESNIEFDNNDMLIRSCQAQTSTSTIKETPLLKTMDKLKQFQFAGNCDLNKFYDEKSKNHEDKKQYTENNDNQVMLNNVFNIDNNITNNHKSSTSSTQISIFESSDCEIDLDI